MSPLRIAVLECDTQVPIVRKKYGGYGGCFRVLLESGAEALAGERGEDKPVELEVTKFDVENAELYPKLENVDAVLISGSKANAFDNAPWILKLLEFTKSVLAQDRVRIIGVCFGHQIIGRALGARVDRSDKGWEMSVTPMELTSRGKEVFGVDDMSIHQMHRDVVYEIPAGVEQLAYSPKCNNQSMYAKGRLITVQGHPEFTDEIVTEIIESRHAVGVFDDNMYKDGMQRVTNKHDGVTIGKTFLKFALEN